jgi:hypothetical protein
LKIPDRPVCMSPEAPCPTVIAGCLLLELYGSSTLPQSCRSNFFYASQGLTVSHFLLHPWSGWLVRQRGASPRFLRGPTDGSGAAP